MKKVLKWILIGLGGIFLIAGAAVVYLSVSGKGEKMAGSYKAKATRANGKILATSIVTQMEMMKIDADVYPDMTKLKAGLAEYGGSLESGPYKAGTADSDETVKNLCPDCTISPQAFKFAIYGNIDEDEELDVITVAQDRKMILVRDDLGEENVPVDITPKGN